MKKGSLVSLAINDDTDKNIPKNYPERKMETERFFLSFIYFFHFWNIFGMYFYNDFSFFSNIKNAFFTDIELNYLHFELAVLLSVWFGNFNHWPISQIMPLFIQNLQLWYERFQRRTWHWKPVISNLKIVDRFLQNTCLKILFTQKNSFYQA